MLDLLEAIMILAWGLSWPVNIYKSVKTRTARGKSLTFEVIIWIGYAIGILRKFIQIALGEEIDGLFILSFVFYWLNIVLITVDISLWFRNRKLDRIEDEKLARVKAELEREEKANGETEHE